MHARVRAYVRAAVRVCMYVRLADAVDVVVNFKSMRMPIRASDSVSTTEADLVQHECVVSQKW